ncbi:YveK family protein [Enterococcus faecium]|uniref:YveK family protein n=1 Tax=Enterococcus faecium TaxID=1352 RepID=UPI0023B207CA|nr:Wzz/FepE/Etk N-terminal domain-containing protein [Enterococcus faecium]
MNQEVNVLGSFQKNKLILFLVPLISMGVAFIYVNFLATPVYRATSQILVYQVENTDQRIGSQDIKANIDLISTYSQIIKSPRVLQKVRSSLGNKYSVGSLSSMISVSNYTSSQIIDINVEGDNYPEIAKLSNEVAKVFKEDVTTLMKIDNVNILSEAEIKPKNIPGPIKPRKLFLIILSGMGGFILAIVIVFTKVLTDRTIKNSEDINKLGITLLGHVNIMDKKHSVTRSVK